MAITDFFRAADGSVLTGNDMEKMCGGLKLTRKQRLIGFGCCFAVGSVISILSTIMLSTLNITGFAIMYTFGNIVSLVGTGFLVGFLSQIKRMFDPIRVGASLIFIGSMVGTLIIAFSGIPLKFILCIILCIIQFLALMWYCASYIPFGRDMIRKLCGSAIAF